MEKRDYEYKDRYDENGYDPDLDEAEDYEEDGSASAEYDEEHEEDDEILDDISGRDVFGERRAGRKRKTDRRSPQIRRSHKNYKIAVGIAALAAAAGISGSIVYTRHTQKMNAETPEETSAYAAVLGSERSAEAVKQEMNEPMVAYYKYMLMGDFTSTYGEDVVDFNFDSDGVYSGYTSASKGDIGTYRVETKDDKFYLIVETEKASDLYEISIKDGSNIVLVNPHNGDAFTLTSLT